MSEPITKELREHAADHAHVELLEIADRIDAEHKRRLEDCRRDVRRDVVRYIRGVLNDYDHNVKRVRKCDKTEVVRCRDCIFGTLFAHGEHRCDITGQSIQDEYYCASGKRKAEVSDDD